MDAHDTPQTSELHGGTPSGKSQPPGQHSSRTGGAAIGLNTIGERIRELRGRRSQSTYAAEIGISKSSLRNYETNTTRPDADFLAVICGLEGVTADWLLFGEESTRKNAREEKPCFSDSGKIEELERRLCLLENILSCLLRARGDSSGAIA